MPSQRTILSLFPCQQCGKPFKPSSQQLRDGNGKYCGRRCYGDAKVTQTAKTCVVCGRVFLVVASRVDSQRACGDACARKSYRKRPTDERFWACVDVRGPEECWPWLKARSRYGYGLFMLEPGKQITASRFSYMTAYGPITDDVMVLHRCDNPPCCNPAHLFSGSKVDNNLDRDNKGRQAHGEGSGRARLTANDVRAIRKRYADGFESQQRIADDYGITQVHVSEIVRRVSWKHVE